MDLPVDRVNGPSFRILSAPLPTLSLRIPYGGAGDVALDPRWGQAHQTHIKSIVQGPGYVAGNTSEAATAELLARMIINSGSSQCQASIKLVSSQLQNT